MCLWANMYVHVMIDFAVIISIINIDIFSIRYDDDGEEDDGGGGHHHQ